jgi:hypothetical protein
MFESASENGSGANALKFNKSGASSTMHLPPGARFFPRRLSFLAQS